MTLNKKTREIWAEKTLELTNIGAGAMIFGQFIADKQFSLQLVLGGLILILFGFFTSYFLLYKK